MASIDNAVFGFLVGTLGLNLQGAQILTVMGRKSGVERSLTVNPLELDGGMYLVSPRGETNWVKNVRAVGTCRLHRGRRRVDYRATQITDDDQKFRIMRAYLDRWSWQVKGFMGVQKTSSDAELRAILDKHPMFELTRV